MDVQEKFSDEDIEELKNDLDSITRMVEEITQIENMILDDDGEVRDDIDMDKISEIIDSLGVDDEEQGD